MVVSDVVTLVVLAIPVLAAGYIVFAKSSVGVARVDRVMGWFPTRHAAMADSSGWSNQAIRGSLWPFIKLGEWTQAMKDPFWRAGTRVVAAEAIALCIAVLAYLALIVVLGILLTIAIGWFIGELTKQSESRPREPDVTPSSRPSHFEGDGESREREHFFGDRYTEHRDSEGTFTGETHQRESFFGERYAQHTNKTGEVVGESRKREGFLGGEYVEHTDADEYVTGESRERTGLLGDEYVEHTDKDGNVVGESRDRKGFFGDDYTEHKGRPS